ncbi:MAG: prolipoprotein diacylglyceryl transferase family protein, partial [Pseudonocardiaceae bacterium]
WNLGVAVLVVWADRRFRLGHGRAFALYVAGYTAGRFWIELIRTDPATMVFGLRINVITSVVVFLAAVLYLMLVRRGREDPETLRGHTPAEPGRAGGTAKPVGAESGEVGTARRQDDG